MEIIISAKLLNAACYFTEHYLITQLYWVFHCQFQKPVLEMKILSQTLPEYYHRDLNANKEEYASPEVQQNQVFNL